MDQDFSTLAPHCLSAGPAMPALSGLLDDVVFGDSTVPDDDE